MLFRSDAAYLSIHVSDERGVALDVDRPVLLSLVPRDIVDDIRLVGAVVGEVEEERVVLVAMDKGNGVIGRNLRVVAYMRIVSILINRN